MIKHIAFISFLAFLLSSQIQADELAVTLQVIASDVTVQRTETIAHIPLPVDAVASVGSGDVIRTGENGRALLSFEDGGSVLLLPDSALTLTQFDEVDDNIEIAMALAGVALFDSIDADFTLEADGFQITEATGNFGVWAVQDDRQAVMVSAGTVILEPDALMLNSGDAWIPFIGDEVIAVEEPYNPARIIGETVGCEALVNTVESTGLLIRAGNGQGYERLDLLPEDSTALLVGITEDSTRYRVQFASGFGWVEALGVENTCGDLPIYAGEQLEMNIRIFGAIDIELSYFEPYYGTWQTNTLFFPQAG